MNRKFEFKVQQDVLDLGVKIKGVRIHDIDNTVYSSALDDYIDAVSYTHLTLPTKLEV